MRATALGKLGDWNLRLQHNEISQGVGAPPPPCRSLPLDRHRFSVSFLRFSFPFLGTLLPSSMCVQRGAPLVVRSVSFLRLILLFSCTQHWVALLNVAYSVAPAAPFSVFFEPEQLHFDRKNKKGAVGATLYATGGNATQCCVQRGAPHAVRNRW